MYVDWLFGFLACQPKTGYQKLKSVLSFGKLLYGFKLLCPFDDNGYL